MAATLASAPAAAADPPPSAPSAPRNAISIALPSLLNSGIALEYERFVGPPRFSFVTGLGIRSSGGRQFDVVESAYGVEGRLWLWGRAPFSRFSERAMIGPYVGARFDYGITRVSSGGHVLGSGMRFAESLSIGVRVVIAGHVEITPSYGIGLRTEVDPRGRLAPWTRGEILRLGLTAGVMF
jgi:hypothetical protein